MHGNVLKDFFSMSSSWLARNYIKLDTVLQLLNSIDQDALEDAAPRAITNAPSSTTSPSNSSFDVQQMAALLEDKMNIRMSRVEKAINEKNATTPATVK
ncbi:hypothetical protein Tco_0734386 [Tanacetum coccineum]